MKKLIKLTATQIKAAGRNGIEVWSDGVLCAEVAYNHMGNYSLYFYNGDELASKVTNGLNSVASVYARLAKEI
jgi:hypothetical protein